MEWYKPWDSVLDESNKPFYQWFVGAKINIVANTAWTGTLDLAPEQARPDMGGVKPGDAAHLFLPCA